MDILWLNLESILGTVFEMFFNDLGSNRDDVLSLPILDQIERLQGADNILCFDGSHITDIFDGKIATMLAKDFKKNLGPITPEAKKTKI